MRYYLAQDNETGSALWVPLPMVSSDEEARLLAEVLLVTRTYYIGRTPDDYDWSGPCVTPAGEQPERLYFRDDSWEWAEPETDVELVR